MKRHKTPLGICGTVSIAVTSACQLLRAVICKANGYKHYIAVTLVTLLIDEILHQRISVPSVATIQTSPALGLPLVSSCTKSCQQVRSLENQ